MMMVLAGSAAAVAPLIRPQARALVMIRIERSGIANAKQWNQTPKPSRRELIVRDDHGQMVLVRVIDYQ